MTKVLVCIAAMLALGACASPRGANGGVHPAKYPARPPHCALSLVHAPVPEVPAWDDLGTAEVTCHIDIGLPQCLERFRAEACRMGGDIVYDLPEKPRRPREQAAVYRGRVAHTHPQPDVPDRLSPGMAPVATTATADRDRDVGVQGGRVDAGARDLADGF